MEIRFYKILQCTALLPCILFVFLSSCATSNLKKRLGEHEQSQKQAYQELLDSTFTTASTPISWSQAKEMLLKQNLAYLNNLQSYKNTCEQRQRIWLNYVPKVFAFASINSSIDKIADITSDDINLNVATSLNIPNPLSLYAQLYSAALLELQGKYQLELSRRQIISTLYSTFLRAQNLEKQIQNLANLRKNIDDQDVNQLATGINHINNLTFQIQSNRESLRISINQLLNTPGEHWKLVGSLPEISYENKIQHLSFKNGYGTLGLKLQTIQIEGIFASLWSAKVARLPSISLGLTPPRLYNTNSDNNFQFDAEDFRLFSGLSKSFELTDIFSKKALRNAEFRAKASRQQLKIRLESEISRLEHTKRIYQKLLQERKLAQEAVRLVQTSTAAANPTQIDHELSRLESANSTLDAIEQQLTQFDLQLWIFDDSRWK